MKRNLKMWLILMPVLVWTNSIVNAEDCNYDEIKSRQEKFAICQRKEINAHRTQGGTKCQLVENIIETCNSMWYFCAANQYEVIERKAIYVKQFLGRYSDESLSSPNCPYIDPFRSEAASANEIVTEELCKQSTKSSVQTSYSNCMYNYATIVSSNLHDSQFPAHQLSHSMCQALSNLTADCGQLLTTCFHPGEQLQMIHMSKQQMIEMFMNFRIDGITEDSLKNCEISESASPSTTISTTASTTTSTTTTTTTSTRTTTTQQSTTISSTQPEMSTLETQAPISTSSSIATNTESVPTLASTASGVVTETENISTTTETATNAADIPKSTTVPQDEFISTEKSETTTTILDIINPRKIGAIDKIVMYNNEQLNDDLTTMSPMKENHEPNIVNDNTADTVEANDFVDIDIDAIATTKGIIQEEEVYSDELYDNEVNPPTQSSFKAVDNEDNDNMFDSDFFQSDEYKAAVTETETVATTEATTISASLADKEVINVTPFDDDANHETGTLGVDIHVEISDYDFDAKDSHYTADTNALYHNNDGRTPLVISGQPTPDPDTQKRSSPDVAESLSASVTTVRVNMVVLLILPALIFVV